MTDPKLEVGCRVLAQTSDGLKEAVVRFIGLTHFAPEQWVGLELPTATGRNNGSVAGKTYFSTKEKHGIFVRPEQVKVLEPSFTSPQTPRGRRATEERLDALSATPSPVKSEEPDPAAPPPIEVSPPAQTTPPRVAPVSPKQPPSPTAQSAHPPAALPPPVPGAGRGRGAGIPVQRPNIPALPLPKPGLHADPETTSLITPRVQDPEGFKKVVEQKRMLEQKLKEHQQLTASQATAHTKEKDEQRKKMEDMRKREAEMVKQHKEEKEELQAKIESLTLDVEILREEKIEIEDELNRLKEATESTELLNRMPETPEEMQEQIFELTTALRQQAVIVESLSAERAMLKETVQELRHYRNNCERLQLEVRDLESQVDEAAGYAEELETWMEKYSALNEDHEKIKRERDELAQLTELNNELEVAMQQELESFRNEALAVDSQKSALEQELGNCKRELVAKVQDLERFKQLCDDLKEQVVEQQKLLEWHRDKAETTIIRQQITENTMEKAKEIEVMAKKWDDEVQLFRLGQQEEYKNWVVDFLPTAVVETETPFLDCMASLDRSLFYAELIRKASGDLSRLHQRDLDGADEHGFKAVGGGLVSDVAFDCHTQQLTSLLLAAHLWLLCLIVHRFQAVSSEKDEEMLRSPDVFHALEVIERNELELFASVRKDAVTPQTLCSSFPGLFSAAAGLWEKAESVTDPEIGVPASSLMFLLLALTTLSDILSSQLETAKRYFDMHLSGIGFADEEEGGWDKPKETLDPASKKAQVTALLEAMEQVNAHRADFHSHISTLYKEMEDDQSNKQYSLQLHHFNKLRRILLLLFTVLFQVRRVALALHDRASDVKHGTTSIEGFFAPNIIALCSEVFLQPGMYTVETTLSFEAPPEAGSRLLFCDVRPHLLPVFFKDKEGLKAGCVDDTCPLPDMVADASNVARTVWAELQKQYWGVSPTPPEEGKEASEKVAIQAMSLLKDRALKVRSKLGSVDELRTQCSHKDSQLHESARALRHLEKQLADSLFDNDQLQQQNGSLKVALEEERQNSDNVKANLENIKDMEKRLEKDYLDAIRDLQTELEGLREDKRLLQEKVQKKQGLAERYLHLRGAMAATHGGKGGGIDIAGMQEIERLRNSLYFSQRMLNDTKTASWQQRWAEAFRNGRGPIVAGRTLPEAVKGQLHEELQKARNDVAMLRVLCSPSHLPCVLPDVTEGRGLGCFPSVLARKEAVKKYQKTAERARDRIILLQALLSKYPQKRAALSQAPPA